MLRHSLLGAVASACVLAACAGTPDADVAAAPAAAPRTQAQAQPQTGGYTDEQLRAYLAARAEIEPITAQFATMTAEQRTAATAQIVQIQQRHNLTASAYDAIDRASRGDQALANRIASLQGFSDAQLQAFAAASVEIDPINRALAAATDPAERAQAADQIRDALARHNLDGATYNAIATRARTDPQISARIQALQQTPSPPPPQ